MSTLSTSALLVIILVGLILGLRRDMAPRTILVLLILLLIQAVAETGGVSPLAFVARHLILTAPLVLTVILHQELRRFLARPFLASKIKHESLTLAVPDQIIEALLPTLTEFSLRGTGALLVLPGRQSITPHVQFGTAVGATLSGEILQSLFHTASPLHDGAVVLQGTTILQAACLLPLSDNQDISKRFGTRHRAALGLSELTDAIVLVVSEENGKISGAIDGNLRYDLSPTDVAKLVETACHRQQIAP